MAKETIQYQELLNVVRSMEGEDELFYFFLRACENGNLKICQICLDAGADINIQEHYYNQTLLNKLVISGKFTTKVGDWLIEKGADVNIHGCGKTNLGEACYQGNYNVARYFIDKGIKIKQYKDDNFSSSDLLNAVYGGNYNIVKMLFELGVDLDSDNYYSNPFYVATSEKKSKIVELFLQKGVSPNSYYYKKTPLHTATDNKDIETANILLRYGANVNAILLKGANRFRNDDVVLTPMDIAVLQKDVEMQRLLSSFNGTISSKEEKIKAITECEDSKKSFSMLKKIMEL